MKESDGRFDDVFFSGSVAILLSRYSGQLKKKKKKEKN
jgi:hypothetical protein